MHYKWEKKSVVVCLLILAGLFFLVNQIFQDQPAAKPVDFVFIFIAFITLFPLIIFNQRPRLSRCVYQYNRRAPPSK
ncbi:MAG: hypothetical protein GY950_07305 [bacterium]|nr:hypothetical protein [bacterium]